MCDLSLLLPARSLKTPYGNLCVFGVASADGLWLQVELNELVAVDAQAKSLMHDVYRYLAAPEQRRSAMSVPGTRQRNQYNRYC